MSADAMIAVTAIASCLAAIGSLGAAIVMYYQFRQASKLSKETAELQTLQKLDEQWQSSRMVIVRRKAAEAIRNGKPDGNVDQVLDFFEEVARLTVRNVLDEKTAWHAFYWNMANYWVGTQEYIRQTQAEEGPTWSSLQSVMPRLRERESKESQQSLEKISPTHDQTKQFLVDESHL